MKPGLSVLSILKFESYVECVYSDVQTPIAVPMLARERAFFLQYAFDDFSSPMMGSSFDCSPVFFYVPSEMAGQFLGSDSNVSYLKTRCQESLD